VAYDSHLFNSTILCESRRDVAVRAHCLDVCAQRDGLVTPVIKTPAAWHAETPIAINGLFNEGNYDEADLFVDQAG
jgi:hypothetical protein